MAKDNKIAGTYEVSPATGYAGDVAPTTAWKILSENKDAVLIDCRTRAEWNYVGLPDLETLAKKPALIEWQVFPSMQPNPEFVARFERVRWQWPPTLVSAVSNRPCLAWRSPTSFHVLPFWLSLQIKLRR